MNFYTKILIIINNKKSNLFFFIILLKMYHLLILALLLTTISPQTIETTELCDSNCLKCTSTPPYLCLTCDLNYNKQHNRCYKISSDCESPCL